MDPSNRELYALLHLDPDCSDDDIKRAYRQWAQIYHPDKHRSPQMQSIATHNFQRIREAYDILSDERKRQIYDIYGLEGLRSGLELGPKLKSREEIRGEFDRLKMRQEEQKLAAHMRHSGSFIVQLSIVEFLKSFDSPPVITGMTMSTQVQAQVSKVDTAVMGGSMYLRRGLGGGAITLVLRRQTSPISSIEILAMAGLRSVLSVQMSRQLSSHSTGSLGMSVSLRDGLVTISNTWSRQLSESTTGTIQLFVGPEAGVAIGWQRQGKKNAGVAEVKVGVEAVGITGHYSHHFSSKSKGRIAGKLGNFGLELELGGEKKISEHSSAAMFCVIGLQGVSWKFRYTRGGQKFIIPVLLCATLNPVIVLGALVLPSSVYTLLKVFVIKPYLLKRRRRKSLEHQRLTASQVLEARTLAEQAQALLKNAAERKQAREAQRAGLIIKNAVYGDLKSQNDDRQGPQLTDGGIQDGIHLPPPYIDVTIPVQFLVDDFGQLQLHGGVKKAGLMGFCDPCPGEGKILIISYSYKGESYEVTVGDFDELHIPQEAHKLPTGQGFSSINLNQAD
ncbi:hypothetical protein O6H91_07G028600 [Diphasiastrum complanatum]|uniref:Uncharacterized protein n=1 Tax=Diphasiastrum complanatum TaxID=34168 RepID=A0ACC2D3L7_DIPCM|nr:hypothetical protein O6H91_07G028600 [Diphasiastrum complanatum]